MPWPAAKEKLLELVLLLGAPGGDPQLAFCHPPARRGDDFDAVRMVKRDTGEVVWDGYGEIARWVEG